MSRQVKPTVKLHCAIALGAAMLLLAACGGSSSADRSGRPATGQSDPCKLVSRAEAQAILGRPIDTPVEAPQGPTCIYRPIGAKNFVTLTIESIDLAKALPRVRKRKRVDVAGRTAYCGNYGQSTTFVQLTRGRVLTVTAPCALGVRFAAKALPRLET
jgi:hypothetical protein